MNGIVNPRHEIVIAIRLRNQAGVEITVDAVLDTGFSDSMTIPPRVVSALGLFPFCDGQGILADGNISTFETFDVEMFWEGTWRAIITYEVGTEPLIGMRIMRNYRLTADIVPGGTVEIVPLP